jgi:chromatin segregation and condensation protein Rec8/ScpA/Scc1 (kleisin family)
VLELVKERRILVLQNRLFGDIRIRARAAEKAPEVPPEPMPEGLRAEPAAAAPEE